MANKQSAAPAGTIAGVGHNSGVKEDLVYGVSKANSKFLTDAANKVRKLGATLKNNTTLINAAQKTRATWVNYGRVIGDVREVIKSNNHFNEWLKDNDLESVADRNTRTDAIWLAKWSDDFVDSVVPADIHSPKAVRAWYRKKLAAVIEYMGGETSDEVTGALNAEDRRFFDSHTAEDWDAAVKAWKEAQTNKPSKWAEKSLTEAVGILIAKIAEHNTPGELGLALVEAIEGEIARGAAAFTAVEPEPAAPGTEPTAPGDPVEEPEEDEEEDFPEDDEEEDTAAA